MSITTDFLGVIAKKPESNKRIGIGVYPFKTPYFKRIGGFLAVFFSSKSKIDHYIIPSIVSILKEVENAIFCSLC